MRTWMKYFPARIFPPLLLFIFALFFLPIPIGDFVSSSSPDPESRSDLFSLGVYRVRQTAVQLVWTEDIFYTVPFWVWQYKLEIYFYFYDK